MRTSRFLRRGRAVAAGIGGRAEGRAALAVLFVAALAGCSMAPQGFEARSEAGVADERSAMAELPPGAGAVVAVLQNETHGILAQRIVLRGDANTIGENSIVVKVNRSRGPSDIDGVVGPPTRARIAGELDEAFAGVEMRLSESFGRNSFGPFGYAVGHPRAGVTCVYAWQWGLWKQPLLGQAPPGAPSLPTEPTSVRARLCRSTLGEAEMVALLRGMQVFPPNSRVAYLDPASAGAEPGGDALAAAGVGYFVVPGVERPVVARERLDPPRKRHKTAHRHRHERFAEDDFEPAPKAAHRQRRERLAEADERAAAPDVAKRDQPFAPMPTEAARPPAAANNALLAPLAAAPAAAPRPRDDMPLPGRSASAERPVATPKTTVSVPLPN